VSASETVQYVYDSLGRLYTVTVSGGPAGGVQTSTTFDPAGNRLNYTVTGVANAAPTFAINSVSAPEGTPLAFTITRSGTATGNLSVSYATSDGTASSASDYTSTSGTVTFLPSETTKPIPVPTTSDSVAEGDETVTMTLSGASAGSTIATPVGTGTINDNSASFAISNAPAVTEGMPMTFTVTRTGSSQSSFSVNYATASGTATSGSDFTATSGTLTFAAGVMSQTFPVPTTDDSVIESDETVLANLSSPTGGATITTSQGSGTINDNDASFAISNAPAVTEGMPMTFTVTRTGNSQGSFSVNYATASGTATSGSDFTATSGTLTFAAGVMSQTFPVPTTDDSVIESDETVLANLSSPTGGATITTAQGSGTINDNDVSFAIGNAPAVTEGGTMTFTVTRTGTGQGSYTVNYATASGTATSGSDFTATSGTLTFAAGVMSQTFPVPTTDDSVIESDETVLANLSSPSTNATITTAQGSGVINDNDVSFAIGNAPAVTEGGTMTFTVTRTGTSQGSFSVNYATASGTATSGSDFTATSGTLTFAAGVMSQTFPVATIDDSALESAETVLANLSSPTGGATITTAQGSGTINDNDVAFAISNSPGANEGGTMTFTVTKAGTTSSSYSVNYTTADGTATSGSDYTATSGTLTFAAGDTSKTITVATIDDSAVESSETILMNLSAPTGGATVTTAQGSGTIIDNDVGFAISNATAVTEGGTLTFTVTKTGSVSSSYSMNYATAGGTATSGSDFTATSGTLTFLPSDVTKTITVATIDDGLTESPETVLMNISAPTGGATITTSQGTGTINDSVPTGSFAISNATAVTEGGALIFTVTKTGTATSVNYASASGTATSGTDFTATSGTLTFSASTTSQTITVPTTDDGVTESAETVLMNLSAPNSGATITTSQGSGTINDNTTPGSSFAIGNATAVTEGGTLTFTVTRTGSASSVNYTTASGTATSGSDFTATSGTLFFTASTTSQTITVATIDDSTHESAETVLVNLSGANGGGITASQGSGTINDND